MLIRLKIWIYDDGDDRLAIKYSILLRKFFPSNLSNRTCEIELILSSETIMKRTIPLTANLPL